MTQYVLGDPRLSYTNCSVCCTASTFNLIREMLRIPQHTSIFRMAYTKESHGSLKVGDGCARSFLDQSCLLRCSQFQPMDIYNICSLLEYHRTLLDFASLLKCVTNFSTRKPQRNLCALINREHIFSTVRPKYVENMQMADTIHPYGRE